MFALIKQQCEKYHIDWKFIKFLFVGVLNTIFGYGMFSLFLFLQFHYSFALFLSTVLGILFNFKTTGIIVFKNNDNKLIFRFFTAYAVVYGLNLFGLKLFEMKNFDMYIAGFILLFPMAVVSFILMKTFVFTSKKEKSR